MRHIITQIKKTYGMAEPEERKAVLHNFAFLSALQAVTYILPLFLLPYLFRVIGPDKFGLLAFAQAFTQYFIILTDYGFNVSATKEVSIHHHHPETLSRIFNTVMTIKIGLVGISFALLCGILSLVPRFGNDWPVYALSFGTVIGNALFPHWFFQGIEKMRPIANLNIMGGILSTALIFLAVRGPGDFLYVPLIQSAVLVVTGLWGQFIVLRNMKVPASLPGWTAIKKELHAGWHIFVSVLAINAYTTTRIFAVGLLTNNTVTGFYAAGEKIAGIFQTFPLVPFSQALFPRLSKIFANNKTRAYEFMQKIQRITLSISCICLPLGFIFAPWIIRIVCGAPYAEAVWVLRIMLIAVLFIGANAFRVQFFLICGRPDLYSRIHLTAALFAVPLLIAATAKFSYYGAAGATVVIEFCVLAATLFTARKIAFD